MGEQLGWEERGPDPADRPLSPDRAELRELLAKATDQTRPGSERLRARKQAEHIVWPHLPALLEAADRADRYGEGLRTISEMGWFDAACFAGQRARAALSGDHQEEVDRA